MTSMRDRFTSLTGRLLDTDPRVVVVLAVIGASRFADLGVTARHPHRVIDVGIREQAQIGVAGGLALEGLRPIVHGYAPFLVERPFEQVKLSLTHQGVGAVLVSVGASYDASTAGRSHRAPEDVALMSTLPGWHVHVPGHPDEVDAVLRAVVPGNGSAYVRLSNRRTSVARVGAPGKVVALRTGSARAPTVVAVGPSIDPVLDATTGHDVTVLGTLTPTPIDAVGLRALTTGTDLVLVEPYLAGTSLPRVVEALSDRPMRYRALGITEPEDTRYGSPDDHERAAGLDAAGIRAALTPLLDRSPTAA